MIACSRRSRFLKRAAASGQSQVRICPTRPKRKMPGCGSSDYCRCSSHPLIVCR